MTDILGKATVEEARASSWARSKGATPTFAALAVRYWRIAPTAGVRPEVAYVQAAKETGFGRFGGVIDESYHNPCGLKKKQGGGNYDPAAHARFTSWDEGVTAHVDHLALYAGAERYPLAKTPDPRHFHFLHGRAKTVEALGGQWAPSKTYGHDLVAMLRDLGATGGSMAGDSLLVSKFVQAKHYTRGPRTKGQIRVIVIHSMEAPEKGTTAENVAAYFARGPVVASAHYNVDNDSIVQSVREADIAYHAPGANHDGIGIEHAGYARQTRKEWEDAFSAAMLKRSAELTAEIAKRYDIPPVVLSVADLKAGKKGFCSHHTVSLAYRRSSHWDPGTGFPWDTYLADVKRFMDGEEEDWLDMATQKEVEAALENVIGKRLDKLLTGLFAKDGAKVKAATGRAESHTTLLAQVRNNTAPSETPDA